MSDDKKPGATPNKGTEAPKPVFGGKKADESNKNLDGKDKNRKG